MADLGGVACKSAPAFLCDHTPVSTPVPVKADLVSTRRDVELKDLVGYSPTAPGKCDLSAQVAGWGVKVVDRF